jgi:hypothetical protein
MKNLKITPPEGYEIDREKSTFEEIVFKPIKKQLPKSWEELERIKGYWVDGGCLIHKYNDAKCNSFNKNTFATEEQAIAFIALAQLSQLREVYRDGWEHSFPCYVINRKNGELYTMKCMQANYFLSFQSEEIRDEFYNNFKDLIEEASPLLFG